MSRVPPGPKDWLFGFGNVNRLRKDPLRFLLDMGRTYGDPTNVLQICDHVQPAHFLRMSRTVK